MTLLRFEGLSGGDSPRRFWLKLALGLPLSIVFLGAGWLLSGFAMGIDFSAVPAWPG